MVAGARSVWLWLYRPSDAIPYDYIGVPVPTSTIRPREPQGFLTPPSSAPTPVPSNFNANATQPLWAVGRGGRTDVVRGENVGVWLGVRGWPESLECRGLFWRGG
ncbi:predicted protein [Plenodomus lingam JN3]|uniref:Predicted protein n=1 Tax=Leptosphaeria maculans (strain JN3 / isolate v23.1.3 / race Av1-4-5-6-7-8) TaxID=985895 RepID=E5A032_LEPMJ|nr:predicted protein [Plenodomus lingam JN3]CBX96892.1 predicted protein [Plenodomus lingam JN3]